MCSSCIYTVLVVGEKKRRKNKQTKTLNLTFEFWQILNDILKHRIFSLGRMMYMVVGLCYWETHKFSYASVVLKSKQYSSLLKWKKTNLDNGDISCSRLSLHWESWKAFIFAHPSFSENPSEPFGASVIIDGVTYGAGTASSKKLAKNKAGNILFFLNTNWWIVYLFSFLLWRWRICNSK